MTIEHVTSLYFAFFILRLLYSVPHFTFFFYFVDKQVVTAYKQMGLLGPGPLINNWLVKTLDKGLPHACPGLAGKKEEERAGQFGTTGFTRMSSCSWPSSSICAPNHNAHLV